MAYVLKDRVQVSSTTTGTGNLFFGSALSGYQDFSVVGEGSKTYYCITDSTNWEVGLGTYATGWSNYFPGETGNYLRILNNALLNPGTDDFVMEAWVYITGTTGSNQGINGKGTAGTDGYSLFVTNALTLSFIWNGTGSTTITAGTLSLNTWAHVAVVRNSGVIRLYLDGVGAGSSTECTTDITSTQNKFVGLARGTNPLKGYISNYRMIKGTLPSGYDATLSSITVPTSPFSDISGTSLLTCRTGVVEDISSNNLDVQQFGDIIPKAFIPFTGISPSMSRDKVYESSNSNNAVNWGSGTKNVFIPFPAQGTGGSVPESDNSAISDNLVSWYNLKKQIDLNVINGTPHYNNNTRGVVSTYSLVYTTTLAYHGGVLAPDGDVYFIPHSAIRGQFVSPSGVVSTYSLVYTTSSAYRGGVLAPNGDIHFVQYNANRGQKVNSSGVVSTYALIYTTASNNYSGGVLDPNGDIHFVPYTAPVGQKVSAAGVVSTYSLVFTKAAAYAGGVLSPNGDIHFIPLNADVGQKISPAGVVSTYSLVHTLTSSYQSGVLAPNGDIHFVPWSAAVGQKVSLSGVVSTYSLAYTTSGGYIGGVLAPNGDIIFIPYNASVGQSISPSGVVSTYSLVYTTTNAFAGGVLTPSGGIYFVPYSAVRSQTLNTGVQVPPGYCFSAFFNKL
jgi:streptogramin lyase